jgi:hypothetical protein
MGHGTTNLIFDSRQGAKCRCVALRSQVHCRQHGIWFWYVYGWMESSGMVLHNKMDDFRSPGKSMPYLWIGSLEISQLYYAA